MSLSPFVGALWEGLVFAEMRRLTQAHGLNRTFWYYRDNVGTEVDFLVLGDGARLIECKWTALPDTTDVRGMEKLGALARASGNLELVGLRQAVLCRPASPYRLQEAQVLGLEGIEGWLRS